MAMWGKPWLLALFALVLAILLISEIPMFSLKLISFSWNENALLYCFLGTVIVGFAVWGVNALSCMIPVYILISCYDFKKKWNWRFWGILVVLFLLLKWVALFIVFPAYLIVLIVKLTVRADQ